MGMGFVDKQSFLVVVARAPLHDASVYLVLGGDSDTNARTHTHTHRHRCHRHMQIHMHTHTHTTNGLKEMEEVVAEVATPPLSTLSYKTCGTRCN